MIVDTHLHYIEAATPDRRYVAAGVMEPVSVDEVVATATAAGVDKVVQVTASTMGYDNTYSFEGARARPDRVLGVFGRFDPIAPHVEERLEAYWSAPEAMGIRQTMFHAESRDWLTTGALDPFLRAAARFGVPVAMFAPFQSTAMLETVDRHPDVRFIADHTLIRHEANQTLDSAFRDWPNLMKLAARPNVWTKLSYFPEASDSEPWPNPAAQRYFRQLVEHAGASRLIWGSNYPPVQRVCTYAQALGFVKDACDFLSPDDRAAILGGNFIRDFSRQSTATSPRITD